MNTAEDNSIMSRVIGGLRNYFWAATTVVTAIDQLTKLAFVGQNARHIKILPGFLEIVPTSYNERGAFSLGPNSALFYIIATAVGLVLIGWFFVTTPAERRLPFIAFGLIAGGAVGNLIDRTILGAVRDFIFMHWLDKAQWPVYNLADAAICIGVALIFFELIFGTAEQADEADEMSE
ncbi:MAG: signal peptidase II [Candidatus Brocadiia bacterium]